MCQRIIKSNKNMGITLAELARACRELVEKGYGDKFVLLSSDDEGNNYHSLFYHFTTDEQADECLKYSNYCDKDHNGTNSVILG